MWFCKKFVDVYYIIIGIFSVCAPPSTLCSPQWQSTCHFIVNHYVKILHVRLGVANNMHPLSWGGTNGKDPIIVWLIWIFFVSGIFNRMVIILIYLLQKTLKNEVNKSFSHGLLWFETNSQSLKFQNPRYRRKSVRCANQLVVATLVLSSWVSYPLCAA